jgi:hypothetical protein
MKRTDDEAYLQNIGSWTFVKQVSRVYAGNRKPPSNKDELHPVVIVSFAAKRLETVLGTYRSDGSLGFLVSSSPLMHVKRVDGAVKASRQSLRRQDRLCEDRHIEEPHIEEPHVFMFVRKDGVCIRLRPGIVDIDSSTLACWSEAPLPRERQERRTFPSLRSAISDH